MSYDGFISYSHAADDQLAPALQRGLQRFAKPWNSRRALRIFRDETGLSTNPHLWSAIEDALDDSEWFVLLASPEAAVSDWVNKEIAHWLATKSIDRMLPVVTDGTWEWDETAGDFTPASSAVPEALRGALAAEPRHLDVRWARSETDLDLRNSRFRSAVADLAAPMHGVAKDELEGEDIRGHRRTVRAVRSAVAILVALLVVAVLSSTLAVTQRNRASQERDRARASARAASLRALVDSSAAQQSTKRDLAALLAVAAYRIAPSTTTEGALMRTFTASPGFMRSFAVPDDSDALGSEVLPDGHTLALVTDRIAVQFIDLRTGASQGTLPGLHAAHDGDGNIDLSPNGRYLALTSNGTHEPSLLTEWDLRTRRRRFPDRPLGFTAGAVALSPDGRLLAVSGGPDGRIEVRSAATGEIERMITSLPRPSYAHYRAYTAAVRFLPDGMLAVGSQEGTVRIVDANTGLEESRVHGPPETSEAALSTSPDGRTLFGIGYQGSESWDLATGRIAWPRPGPGQCNGIVVAALINAVLCPRADGRVQAIDLATGTVIASQFDYQAGTASGVTIGDHGNVLIETGGDRASMWRLDGTGPIARRVLSGADLVPQEFDTRGDLIVGHESPGILTGLRVVDPNTGTTRDPLPHVVYATTTPDPDRLIALFSDGTGGFYDLSSHRRVPGVRLRLPFFPTFAGKSDRTLVIGHDGTMQGIDMITGALVPPTAHQATEIYGVDADPAGNRWLSGEPAGMFLRTRSGAVAGRAIPGAQNGVIDARDVVITTSDGHVNVLNVTTLRPDGAALPSTIGIVDSLQLSRRDDRLLLVGRDGTVRIADLQTRQLIGDAIRLGDQAPREVLFRPDGRALVFSDQRGITLWNLEPKTMLRAACAVASRNLTHAEWNANLQGLGPYQRVCPDQPASRAAGSPK